MEKFLLDSGIKPQWWSLEKELNSYLKSIFTRVSLWEIKRMELESWFSKMEVDMRVSGLMDKKMVGENMRIGNLNTIIRVNGRKEKNRAMDTCSLKISAYFRELFRIIIDMDLAPRNLSLEILTKVSTKKENSMEKEFISGVQEQVSRETLSKESSKVKENGDLRQANYLWDLIWETRNMGSANTNGKMEPYLKANSDKTDSTNCII